MSIYRFVVGDPILLWGGVASLALARWLYPTGHLDGVILFVAVAVVLCLSLALRSD
jgi:hypothetical protein